MAQVDKASVREEVTRIREDFDRLCQEKGRVDSEVKLLMKSMFMMMELILSIFLERKTRKNSKNSGIPSSQTNKDESSLTSTKGSKSKGKAEKELAVSNTRVKETVKVSKVHSCDACGEDLKAVERCDYERRTKIDIVFEKVVEHVDAEIKQCPSCAATTKAPFPSDLHGPLQYGDGLKAFVINLLVCQMVA